MILLCVFMQSLPDRMGRYVGDDNLWLKQKAPQVYTAGLFVLYKASGLLVLYHFEINTHLNITVQLYLGGVFAQLLNLLVGNSDLLAINIVALSH